MAAEKKQPKKSAKKKPKVKLGSQSSLKIIFIFFVAIAIVFIAARTIGGITLTTVSGDAKDFFKSLGAGGGYPYKTTGEQTEQMFLSGRNILTFSKDKTVLLSPRAKELSRLPIQYSNPAIKFKDKKVLIYDRDSSKMRIQDSSEVIAELDLKNTILSAAVGKKGNFAAALKDSGSASTLKVFRKNQKELCSRTFNDEKITDIDLSDDGRYAVVGTISSKDAQINSKVYVLKFDSEGFISTFDFKNCAVVSVRYDGSHNISVITSAGRSYIEDNSTLGKQTDFAPDKLFKYSVGEGKHSAVALKKYGGDNFGTVKIFNGGKGEASVSIDKEIKDVCCTGNYTFVLTSDSIIKIRNSSGKVKKEISTDSSVNEISVKNKKVYMLSPSEISCKKFR